MTDYQDLVKRLHNHAAYDVHPASIVGGIMGKAADAIETLLRERDELRNYNIELQGVTDQICIDKIVKDRDAAIARAERLEKELREADEDLRDIRARIAAALSGDANAD